MVVRPHLKLNKKLLQQCHSPAATTFELVSYTALCHVAMEIKTKPSLYSLYGDGTKYEVLSQEYCCITWTAVVVTQ